MIILSVRRNTGHFGVSASYIKGGYQVKFFLPPEFDQKECHFIPSNVQVEISSFKSPILIWCHEEIFIEHYENNMVTQLQVFLGHDEFVGAQCSMSIFNSLLFSVC